MMAMVLDNGNNLFQEFHSLFFLTDTLSGILLVSGFVLCAVYLLRQEFKGIYFFGFALMIAGTCTRMANGGSLQMLVILTLIIALPQTLFYFIGVRLTRYEWLSRRADSMQEAVDSPQDKELYFLLNHEGVTASELNPTGTIIINDIEFEATTRGEKISPQTPIKVTEVENEMLFVKPV